MPVRVRLGATGLTRTACGPEEFTRDVRNANAAGQLRIARGRATLDEAVLHTEAFEL